MIIKKYGDLPTAYAPDVGEVIYARRTPVDKWVKAVVLMAHRNRAGNLRIKVQWLGDDPDAGAPTRYRPRVEIRAGEHAWVVVDKDPTAPRLVYQYDQGAAQV